jgi:MFS family permease
MTDDTTLPEIPSQLRRTSTPGFMTGSPVKPTAAATRARESKIRKSIKTVTPVKTATSIYAQMLRWSFGATLLVSAIIVGFISLTWQAGNPPFYLFAILAGTLGAFMSTLIRLYNYEEFPRLVHGQGIERLRRSDLTVYSLVPPVVGALSAAILFIAFAAGVVQGGSFFPTFACQTADKICGTFDTLIHQFGPADATDYARTLVWCFVAGFAERLVPDKLKGLAAGAGDK